MKIEQSLEVHFTVAKGVDGGPFGSHVSHDLLLLKRLSLATLLILPLTLVNERLSFCKADQSRKFEPMPTVVFDCSCRYNIGSGKKLVVIACALPCLPLEA